MTIYLLGFFFTAAFLAEAEHKERPMPMWACVAVAIMWPLFLGAVAGKICAPRLGDFLANTKPKPASQYVSDAPCKECERLTETHGRELVCKSCSEKLKATSCMNPPSTTNAAQTREELQPK